MLKPARLAQALSRARAVPLAAIFAIVQIEALATQDTIRKRRASALCRGEVAVAAGPLRGTSSTSPHGSFVLDGSHGSASHGTNLKSWLPDVPGVVLLPSWQTNRPNG
jgi:hypothetical protein